MLPHFLVADKKPFQDGVFARPERQCSAAQCGEMSRSEARSNSTTVQHSAMIQQHNTCTNIGVNPCACTNIPVQPVRVHQGTRATRARAPTYSCNPCACTNIHVQPVRVHQHTRATCARAPTYTCNPCACTNIGVNPCVCTTSLPCLSLTGCGCFSFRRVGNIAQCMDMTCNNSTCGISG